MPLIDLPAHAVLKLPRQTSIAWAVFDAAWYVFAYAEVAAWLAGASPDLVLQFYLDRGQRLGHSPNMLFDEMWHRRTYPSVAAAVDAGIFASAFDSYCRGGTDRSPHWLFDEAAYRRRYLDLSDEALVTGGLANGYDHFLRHGDREARVGHRMFDSARLLSQLDQSARLGALTEGPFPYYLRCISRAQPDLRTTPYFAPGWYVDRYPEVTEAIAGRVWLCALHHYLCNATPSAFDPLPDFSEPYYLSRYSDLRPAIEAGTFRNGYDHFLQHGASEYRSPTELMDLRYYSSLETVRNDLEQDVAPDAYTHWLTIGRTAGLNPAQPAEERITEIQAKALFRQRADILRPLFGRAQLRFVADASTSVSVIMVLHDQFAMTMMAVASLHANCAGNVALILVDSGSTDETRAIERYVTGATIIRFDDNVEYVRGCNAALQAVCTEAVLLLNNDIELAPGAVRAALLRLRSHRSIGAVGGKVVRAHGLLQEAGNIIWRDGTTKGYLRDASPLVPEANFVRDVDFCSGVFLLVRADLLRSLNGFDEDFAPAYYEDADLCVRIAAAGYRVVYDPGVVISHLEYGSAASTHAVESAIDLRRQVFVRKHAAWLATRGEQGGRAQLFARTSGAAQKRILFIEDRLPLRFMGSGFVRSNDVLRAMASLGHAVTLFPLQAIRVDLAAIYADMPDTVEIMHDQSLEQLQTFLLLRRGYYDAIWVERTHNLSRISPMLERLEQEHELPPIILDSEAISAVREAQLAARDGIEFDLHAAIQREFAEARRCSQVIAVNAMEAQLLCDVGFSRPIVLGHTRRLAPTPRSFAQRSGLLFVGAMHRMDSPNYDSLCWFIDEVLPLVEQDLGWETRLTVVGYQGPDVTLARFADHPRVTLRGTVADTLPLFDAHRLFVAPTRIAAGMPYKIHEAASYGLPVVTTELLRRQLGWSADEDLLTAEATDAMGFAQTVVRLFRDEALWLRLRKSALARLATEVSQELDLAAISTVLESTQGSRQP
jgi:GT2 family glycosyltransferase